MEENEKVATYVSKVQNLVHLMKGYGGTMTDKMIIEKVMKTLISHFDHVIVSIQESSALSIIKLEDLVDLLEAHEMRVTRVQDHSAFASSDLEEEQWKWKP